MGSWRKAYGALKDSTKVGLAKINSDFKDLDIAIVKATNHVECPPKERHVRKIFGATSVLRPRADVAYCIHALARRLHKTKSWIVAMKILIVIHRTLREGDPIFREELLNYSHRGQVLQISNFKDDSSPLAWDCSAWVRTYALFLEERLECFRVLKYDIEAERLVKSSQGSSTKGHSRTRDLGCQELLDQLPALQQLLFRLNGCQPEGAAFGNYLIQYALALVLKESFKIYCAINDGIINLVDMFFEMSRHDAIKALNIYKRAGHQAENLAEFYEFCKGLELARNFQFPTLRLPPPSFLATMEEYIKEAPRTGSMSSKALEYDEKNLLTYKEEEQGGEEEEEQKESPPGSPESPVENEENLCEEPQELASSDDAQPAALLTGDFLCLDEVNHDAAELEESNALALAIVPPGGAAKTSAISLFDGEASGWELALVTASSSNESHVAESKLAGGFNKLLLDSLYEDGETRKQMNDRGYGCGLSANPFERHDPFAMSNSIAPPTSVQMAMMAQQQQYYYLQQQQQNMMMPYPYQPNYPQQQVPMGAPNPFHDPFSVLPQSVAPHQGNQRLM